MQNSLEQLKNSLKEMFQFQNNDLNFGIYKIYKLKQKEIEKFIDDNLENIVKKELQNVSNLEEKSNLLELELFLKWFNQEKLLEDINSNYEKIDWFINLWWNWDTKKLKEILKSGRNWSIEWDLENKIYNYILNFFELYYSEWDFGYNTRSLNTYKVEYDEDYKWTDIMFHWKHKWSYYIKSGNGFNSVKFALENKNIEFLLESNEESEWEEISQNNNRETEFKHYKFNRIENIWDTTFKVIFNLSKTSTAKEEIFKKIFEEIYGKNLGDEFLFNKEWKSIFNSLDKNFEKIENWNIKGFSQLKIKKDDLVKKYDSNFWKWEKINKSFDELDKSSEIENTIITLWSLDNKLNSFYIWNDSDFFIHKNLNWFLTKEKEKFIKNNILWDLSTILNSKIDNTTLVIAKTFNEISSKIIEFLSAIEEFQKWIFESKKKVLVSEYCITLDKIGESFYDEILANKEQIQEWKNLWFISDEKVLNKEYLRQNQTLNIDTKFFSKDFKDRLLNTFEDLEEQTNWILINSENFQALNLLKNKYRWKVKCIYIDPPYNTWNNFVYKNTFKHSSWLSMMENRLLEAKELLTKDWVLIIAIDENEQENLWRLLNNLFDSETYEIHCISVVHNPKWIQWWYISTNNEYAFVVSLKWLLSNDKILDEKNYIYENFRNWWWESERETAKNCFYPIFVKEWKIIWFWEVCKDDFHPWNKNIIREDWVIEVYPVDWKWIERKWTYANFNKDKIIDRLRVKTLNNWEVDIEKIRKTERFKTIWDDSKYIAWDYWTKILNNIIWSKKFDFPKSIHLVKDSLFLATDSDSIVLDFFSWSWTTQQAVIELNKEEKENLKKEIEKAKEEWNNELLEILEEKYKNAWKRKYIWVEMWEYFDSVTKPRVQKVIYTSNWKNWLPLDNKWVSQIMKYQVLEQYEDMLDKLEIDNEDFPEWLDLRYLYKKEEIKLKSTLDLRKPFENNYIYGKAKKQTQIDLIETYNYAKGNNIENIKSFEIAWKYYKCVKIWNILQIWRNIEIAENDLKNIEEILRKYENIETLEINAEIYSLERDKFGSLELNWKNFDIEIIDESLFNE